MNGNHTSLRNKSLVTIGALLVVLSAVALGGFWSSSKTAIAFDNPNRTSVSQVRAHPFMTPDLREQAGKVTDLDGDFSVGGQAR